MFKVILIIYTCTYTFKVIVIQEMNGMFREGIKGCFEYSSIAWTMLQTMDKTCESMHCVQEVNTCTKCFVQALTIVLLSPIGYMK